MDERHKNRNAHKDWEVKGWRKKASTAVDNVHEHEKERITNCLKEFFKVCRSKSKHIETRIP